MSRIPNAVRSVLAVCGLAVLVPDQAAGAKACPAHLKQRSAEETIQEHLALLQAGEIDLAMCDYAEEAVVILPGQVVTGLDNIRGGLGGVGALLGGAVPQIQTLTATEDTVLITFVALGTPCTIPDGSDTYIVRKGKIVTQTVHDTFRSAPGFMCPVAAPGL
jgi:ketosteroid isomerase-like protein